MKLVKKLMLQNQRQALGTLEGLVKLVKLASTLMLQNQRQALGTLDGTCKTCKTCKHIHATKSKACTLGLWMGFVKLVKHVNTFMLQNQRSTKHLYRIDSNANLYRIILGGFYSTSDIFSFVLMLAHVRFLIL